MQIFLLFPHSVPAQFTWTVVKGQKRHKNLVYNNFPLHYIIHNSKAHKFLLSGKEEERILNDARRKKNLWLWFFSCSSFELLLEGGGKDEKRKYNQNCMWFVISLVFVKVTNSISAWETGKPKKLKKRKILLTQFSLGSVFMRGEKQQWMKTNPKSYNSSFYPLSRFNPPKKLLIYIEILLNWMLLA